MITKVTVIRLQNKSLGEGIQEFWEYRELLYTWMRQQSELLRQRKFDQLDLSHSIEEIIDLGNRHYDQFRVTVHAIDRAFVKVASGTLATI